MSTMSTTEISGDTRYLAAGLPSGVDELLVRTFEGSEQLGRPFQFQVELLGLKIVDPTKVIGKNMTVRMTMGDGKPRFFNGYVSRFVHEGMDGRLHRFRATLVPWLWFLTRQSDCRLFFKTATADLMKKTKVPEIIQEIWKTAGFTDYEDRLKGTYPERELTVQYRETTFAFCQRLMEYEGIYYYFKHEDGKHTLVLADDPANHDAGPAAEVSYLPTDSASTDEERINLWTVERELQTTKTALTDYDFKKPKTALLATGAMARDVDPEYEFFDYPGDYTVQADGDRLARTRAEESACQFMTVHAQGNCRGIASGFKFKLVGQLREDMKDEFLAVDVRHHAVCDAGDSVEDDSAGADGYVCSFTARKAADQFRPQRLTPKPVVNGPQTAVVCGKSGEEIETDEYGQIKVHFHWDRYGKMDENASPWIRVAQSWAGKKWGSIHTPRIGQEVMVEFLEGDPDKPIVTGRVYNNEHMPPYALPDNKTISGIKSDSSKGGAGFNELRFEDKKGEEQIFMHGEKNLDVRIKNDAHEFIGHDKHLQVENDNHVWIKNDEHVKIARDQVNLISRDRGLKVDGKESVEITKSKSLKVGDDVIEEFKKNQSTQVTENYYLKAKNIVLEAAENITIMINDKIYLAFDSKGVKIGSSGKVELESTGAMGLKSSDALKMEAAQAAELKGGTGLKMDGGPTVELKASGSAKVDGGGSLSLKGGAVKIN